MRAPLNTCKSFGPEVDEPFNGYLQKKDPC